MNRIRCDLRCHCRFLHHNFDVRNASLECDTKELEAKLGQTAHLRRNRRRKPAAECVTG